MNSSGIPGTVLGMAISLTLTGCYGEAYIDDGHGHGHNAVSVDASISGYDWEAYATYVPYGTRELAVDLHNLSQDADLYVESPDGGRSCESLHSGRTPDFCIFDYPMPGDWYVEVFGWEYDPMDYTLTVTLWPSDLDADLWLIESVDAYSANMESLAATTSQTATAKRLLPLLKAAVAATRTLPRGEHRFRVRTAAQADLGTAVLIVTDEGYRRSIQIKAVMADPKTGARHVIQTDARHPVVIAAVRNAPTDGIMNLRRKGRSTTVRLGQATGTGADVQLLTNPGPIASELSWAGIDDDQLQLAPE